ncbi:MAG: TIR domain-containing protein, partial [Pseudomonadota bacterium]
DYLVARDNVIFESGLFIGSLGRLRAFVLKPADDTMRIPSDLAGVTVATFEHEADNLAVSLGPACQRIKKEIEDNLVL